MKTVSKDKVNVPNHILVGGRVHMQVRFVSLQGHTLCVAWDCDKCHPGVVLAGLYLELVMWWCLGTGPVHTALDCREHPDLALSERKSHKWGAGRASLCPPFLGNLKPLMEQALRGPPAGRWNQSLTLVIIPSSVGSRGVQPHSSCCPKHPFAPGMHPSLPPAPGVWS